MPIMTKTTKIKGKYNTALCYASTLEKSATEQIENVCNMEAFSGAKLRIMPDVHAGIGCTIGTTMTITDKVVPGMVGVDIGCGMETVLLANDNVDLAKLDECIHKSVPAGFNILEKPCDTAGEIDLSELRCSGAVNFERAYRSIGTLGGGNHFIEAGKDDTDRLYLIVHSGSRNIGHQVATYYQSLANEHCTVPLPDKNLSYIDGSLFSDYVHDMKIVQHFAVLNRKAIINAIFAGMGFSEKERFTTIHNYIDTDEMVLRKGAVSAKEGEKLLIPINMRDGSLVCLGKGNPEWNFSAPHGAGRLLSRGDAIRRLSFDDYESEMREVYSSCVTPDTLDEAPMAYKPIDEIVSQITPTAEVLAIIKPIYNFKSTQSKRKRR